MHSRNMLKKKGGYKKGLEMNFKYLFVILITLFGLTAQAAKPKPLPILPIENESNYYIDRITGFGNGNLVITSQTPISETKRDYKIYYLQNNVSNQISNFDLEKNHYIFDDLGEQDDEYFFNIGSINDSNDGYISTIYKINQNAQSSELVRLDAPKIDNLTVIDGKSFLVSYKVTAEINGIDYTLHENSTLLYSNDQQNFRELISPQADLIISNSLNFNGKFLFVTVDPDNPSDGDSIINNSGSVKLIKNESINEIIPDNSKLHIVKLKHNKQDIYMHALYCENNSYQDCISSIYKIDINKQYPENLTKMIDLKSLLYFDLVNFEVNKNYLFVAEIFSQGDQDFYTVKKVNLNDSSESAQIIYQEDFIDQFVDSQYLTLNLLSNSNDIFVDLDIQRWISPKIPNPYKYKDKFKSLSLVKEEDNYEPNIIYQSTNFGYQIDENTNQIIIVSNKNIFHYDLSTEKLKRKFKANKIQTFDIERFKFNSQSKILYFASCQSVNSYIDYYCIDQSSLNILQF